MGFSRFMASIPIRGVSIFSFARSGDPCDGYSRAVSRSKRGIARGNKLPESALI
jgi:hypothetical protein